MKIVGENRSLRNINKEKNNYERPTSTAIKFQTTLIRYNDSTVNCKQHINPLRIELIGIC